jgi:hypothetical protein
MLSDKFLSDNPGTTFLFKAALKGVQITAKFDKYSNA